MYQYTNIVTIKRLCQRLNEIMVFAVNTGITFYNSLAGIKVAFEKPKPKNFPTLRPETLPNFMQALNTAKINLVTPYLVQWQLHTMSAGAQWDEIDFDNQLWIMHRNRMKKGKPLTVPLSPQAMAILESIKPISLGSPFVFPADRSPNNQIRRAYNQAEYLERRRIMMCWWSEHIERCGLWVGEWLVSASSYLLVKSPASHLPKLTGSLKYLRICRLTDITGIWRQPT